MYKLINTKTGEGTICDKVTLDGFDYYVSDEKTLSNNGDWYLGHPNYNTLFKWNMFGIHEGKQVWINKVIATNNPSIDIPKVVDEVEKLAYDKFPYTDTRTDFATEECRNIFKIGYNKSQETHPFSEEDVRFMLSEAFKASQEGYQITSDEIIKLWEEQRVKTVYYEHTGKI